MYPNMRGDSLVRTTYAVDADVERLLDEPRVPGPSQQERECFTMMQTLTDLTETVRSGMPLPPGTGNETEEHDSLVIEVVELVYGTDPVTISDLGTDPEPALKDGRLRRTGDHLHVPLEATQGSSRNWWLVFQFVRNRLDEIRVKTRRILSRVQQSDHMTDGDCWQGVQRMIERIRRLILIALARQSWFRHHAEYDDQLIDSVTDITNLLRLEPDPLYINVQA